MQQQSSLDKRHQIIRTVTIIGAVVNLILAIIKIIIGKIAYSHALVVDGIHSLSDLVSDGIVLFAAKHSNEEADTDHPYGHGRFETIFTVVLGTFLGIIGIGIIIDAIEKLYVHEIPHVPTFEALIVAIISVASKEILYRYTLYHAKTIHSNLLKANAWHHRSDAISSIVVLIGVAGGMYGVPYLDIVAAVIVAMMIAKIGWDLISESVNELVDKGLESDELAEIKLQIESLDDVIELHSLRTRYMGGKILADVHIQVSNQLSVSEGHRIADEVHKVLLGEFEKISDVLVHVDPENDEDDSYCRHLPLRKTVQAELLEHLTQLQQNTNDTQQKKLITEIRELLAEHSNALKLHYCRGEVHLEIFLPKSLHNRLSILEQLQKDMQEHMSEHSKQLKSLNFLLSVK